ncbi:uncharacterized protein LOC115893622 [Rhinopithecus roxellana]|uniref:uncharacterized protein LOC115893622 n=1 Tax=Rhinopithecus roxellana TaxID=61622 RepID=UPI00123743E4|nr:uncharacterized protein LOC115893622 [Rhinopithecus roxellana]
MPVPSAPEEGGAHLPEATALCHLPGDQHSSAETLAQVPGGDKQEPYPPLPVSTGWCERGPPATPQQETAGCPPRTVGAVLPVAAPTQPGTGPVSLWDSIQDLLKWPMIQRSPDFTHGQLPSPSSLRPKDLPSPVLSRTNHLPGFCLRTPKLSTDRLAAWVTGSRGTGFSPCQRDEDKFSLHP